VRRFTFRYSPGHTRLLCTKRNLCPAVYPYINNALAAAGAVFSDSFAIEHPSEPNYLDLFSGSHQGVTSYSCPHTFSATNEAAQLL
jgi:hypothetical protein